MTLGEAKSKISEVQNSTKDYQDSINAVQTQLMTLIDDINSVKRSISSEIKEDGIISHSNSTSSTIVSKINETLAKSSTALDTLSNAATKYIREIVDSYNSSLEPDSEEERLSYVEIKLSSISGCPTESDTINTYNYYGNYTDEREDEITIDYYLNMLNGKSFYSKDINDWDHYVKRFLEENNLTKVIDTIIVEGKVIKIKLKNGNEYEFEEITSTIDLLKALYEKIEQDNGGK